MVFTPGLMEGQWDSLIWDTDGFIAEGKETDVMNHSLVLKTPVTPVTSAHIPLAKASHIAKPKLPWDREVYSSSNNNNKFYPTVTKSTPQRSL